jgi:hypothetical protein
MGLFDFLFGSAPQRGSHRHLVTVHTKAGAMSDPSKQILA